MPGCSLCPRACMADRAKGEKGFCCMGEEIVIARAAPHFGEEPCISGSKGSGTVFFSGCNMRCVFCQNREISFNGRGKAVSAERLSEIFMELQALGVHNINLVTPTHYTIGIIDALKMSDLSIPVVWNSSGYENVETLKKLEGLVSVYMPDMKYFSPAAAERYSKAPDYPHAAKLAIGEMFRQTGPFIMEDGLLKRGVLIRHLILPGLLDEAFDAIDYVAETFPAESVMFSLMSQYVPEGRLTGYPELCRKISSGEYLRAKSYLDLSGISAGYFQELSSATKELVPDFDLTGV